MKKFAIYLIAALTFVSSTTALADTDYLAYKAQLDQKYLQMLMDTQHGLSADNRALLEQNYLQLVDLYAQGNVATPPASYEQQLAFQENQDLQQYRQQQAQEQNKAQEQQDKTTALLQQQADETSKTRKRQDSSDFAAGKEAYDKQDYAMTVKLWQPLAEQGDAAAQLGLGLLYRKGQGVPQDDRQAQYWLCQSVKQGNADAAIAISTAATGTANPHADVVATVYCGNN